MARVLVVGGDMGFAAALGAELRPRAWSVEVASDWSQMFALLERQEYDVGVLDWGGDQGGGLGLLGELRRRGSSMPVVVLCAGAGIAEAVRAVKAGAEEFFSAPVDPVRLSRVLAELGGRRGRSPHVLACRLDLYLRENCAYRGMALRHLGEHFRISPGYARKLFERHVGMSFRQRLQFFRLQHAKKLIVSTDLPLYLVAEQSGFGTPSQLSLAFLRQEGLSPRRYRSASKG